MGAANDVHEAVRRLAEDLSNEEAWSVLADLVDAPWSDGLRDGSSPWSQARLYAVIALFDRHPEMTIDVPVTLCMLDATPDFELCSGAELGDVLRRAGRVDEGQHEACRASLDGPDFESAPHRWMRDLRDEALQVTAVRLNDACMQDVVSASRDPYLRAVSYASRGQRLLWARSAAPPLHDVAHALFQHPGVSLAESALHRAFADEAPSAVEAALASGVDPMFLADFGVAAPFSAWEEGALVAGAPPLTEARRRCIALWLEAGGDPACESMGARLADFAARDGQEAVVWALENGIEAELLELGQLARVPYGDVERLTQWVFRLALTLAAGADPNDLPAQFGERRTALGWLIGTTGYSEAEVPRRFFDAWVDLLLAAGARDGKDREGYSALDRARGWYADGAGPNYAGVVAKLEGLHAASPGPVSLSDRRRLVRIVASLALDAVDAPPEPTDFERASKLAGQSPGPSRFMEICALVDASGMDPAEVETLSDSLATWDDGSLERERVEADAASWSLTRAVRLDLATHRWSAVEADAIDALPRLRRLTLSRASADALALVHRIVRLPHLSLNDSEHLLDVAALHAHPSLRKLSVRRRAPMTFEPGWLPASVRALQWKGRMPTVLGDFPGLEQLEELDLSFGSVRTFGTAEGLASLQALRLNDSALTSLAGVEALTGLRRLEVAGGMELRSLEPLTGLSDLAHLNVSGATAVTDVTPLASMGGLRWLAVSGVDTVEPLAALHDLETLFVHGCRNLRDLDFILPLRGLRRLILSRCADLRDLSALEQRPDIPHVVVEPNEHIARVQRGTRFPPRQNLDP